VAATRGQPDPLPHLSDGVQRSYVLSAIESSTVLADAGSAASSALVEAMTVAMVRRVLTTFDDLHVQQAMTPLYWRMPDGTRVSPTGQSGASKLAWSSRG
jgi:hypothetical protein